MAGYHYHQLQTTSSHVNNRLSYAVIAALVIFMIVNISTRGDGSSANYVHSTGRFSNPDEVSWFLQNPPKCSYSFLYVFAIGVWGRTL